MSVILLPDFIIPKGVAHTFDNLERIVTRDEPTWLIGPAAAEMLIFWFNGPIWVLAVAIIFQLIVLWAAYRYCCHKHVLFGV